MNGSPGKTKPRPARQVAQMRGGETVRPTTAERQQRQAKELEIYTQKLLAESERARTNSSPNKSNP